MLLASCSRKKSFNSLHSFYLLRFNILFRWNQHQLSMKCLFFFFNFPAIKKSTQKIFNQHQQSHSTKHRMKFPDFFISYEWKKIFWVVQSMKRRYERRNRFQLFLSMKKFKFEKFLRERISARFEYSFETVFRNLGYIFVKINICIWIWRRNQDVISDILNRLTEDISFHSMNSHTCSRPRLSHNVKSKKNLQHQKKLNNNFFFQLHQWPQWLRLKIFC